MEGETFINRLNMETERIVQDIELDAPVYDWYIKHIENFIPTKDVKIKEHRIDVFLLPYLYPGRYFPICVLRGEMMVR